METASSETGLPRTGAPAEARFAPSWAALASALGVDRAQLRREQQRAGRRFPLRGPGGWNIDAVAKWRSNNIFQRKQRNPVSKGISPAAAAGEPSARSANRAPRAADTAAGGAGGLSPGDRHAAGGHPGAASQPLPAGSAGFIGALMGGKASALEISRAAMQLMSRHVGLAAAAGELHVQEIDRLKKTLAELRQAESDYLDLEKSQRKLLERAEVEAIIGAMVARLVRACGLLENSIATEFALWLEDPKVQALPGQERERVVQEFVAKTLREVRQLESDGVAAIIDRHGEEDDDLPPGDGKR